MDIATLPVEVKIIPDQKALSVIVFKVAHTHRAYPVRGLSRLFLENTGSCNVRLEVKADHPDVMLHQCPVCGQIDTDADHLAAHMLAEHFDDFFEKVTVEEAEPTGAFTSIAKCGLSGRLIGPPNHHSFARRFREIKGEVAPRMSDEDYRRRMEIVHDPEVVAQWKQEARIRALYRRHAEADAPAAAPGSHAEAAAPESHAEIAESTEAAAPTAAPESHAEAAEAAAPSESSTSSVPDCRPEQAGASPAGPEAAPVADEPLLERAAAEEIVRSQIVPKRMLTRKRFVCSVEQAEAIRDPQIAPAFRVVWRREQATPTTLFHAVRGALRSRKFHLFRAGNASGMEFVLAKVPTPLDVTHAVPELVQVMDYVTKHECCTRAELFAALGIPLEGTRSAEQDRLYQQFAWIVERGHLIEYHNGVLALPAEFPKFRNLPATRKVSAAPESHAEAAAPAAAPESHAEVTESAEAAAPATAPETHAEVAESAEVAAPAAAPESHAEAAESAESAAPAAAPREQSPSSDSRPE